MFGQMLKALRTAKGLTQQDIANYLGVTPEAVGNWERGTREPDLATLLKLAKYFDVAVHYLLTGTDDPNRRPPWPEEWEPAVLTLVSQGYSPEEVLEAVRLYRVLQKELPDLPHLTKPLDQ
ncbi:hypothetical protein caldi_29760 [Caldinitratiruptor microaerophilus]|uniref:HTH cro/C1-type domain-containing protein n=2 Tax=Caldinitratiruptor microaerophilus TaxID=671077 RepID=A0AA35CQ40_9FIRM|nr:hypothetical protein caldi_29760 [Caldinitratiruptor microaerophilus]